jgi:8-oxo-dGTP diphosphatase
MQDKASVLLGCVSAANLKDGDIRKDEGLWAIPDGIVNDGETIRDACIRTVKEATGLDVEPRMTLFLCERVVEGDHRIGIFVLAEPTNTGIVPNERYTNMKWIDVRELGNLQKNEGMSDFTADAFRKFSEFLKSAIRPSNSSIN